MNLILIKKKQKKQKQGIIEDQKVFFFADQVNQPVLRLRPIMILLQCDTFIQTTQNIKPTTLSISIEVTFK